ncbi:MAG: sigma-70 family RNA polymerase sigma factor [Phycisphaerae bacterium]|nr:sigma-70 family RNA polymerase sigma factor [Phycisphaerae bacterium]
MDQKGIDILVKSASAGDRQAYGELVGRFYRPVLLECLAVLGRFHDAEDAAQETLLQGFMQLPSLRNPSQFPAWIRAIARNLCLNRLRRPKAVSGLDPNREVAKIEGDYRDLYEAISLLPMELRTSLLLYYLDGQDVKTVAQRLGVSPSTVYGRLQTALRQLSERLLEL